MSKPTNPSHFKVSRLFRLLAGLLHGRRAYTGPFCVEVDITRRCNIQCIGCLHHFAKQELDSIDLSVKDIPLDLVNRLACELPLLGCEKVIFSGTGEPLLHPKLSEIIATFKQSGLDLQLFTNGTLLDEPRALAILNSGLDKLVVSLWTGSPEAFTQCHPGMNAAVFGTVTENLSRFCSLKTKMGRSLPVVFVKHICNLHTLGNIEDTIKLAHSTGCDGILFTPFVPRGDDTDSIGLSDAQTEQLLASFTEVRRRMSALSLQHNLDEPFSSYEFNRTAWRRVPCYIGWYQTKVRIDGGVMPCCNCNILLGDVNKTSLKAVWNSPQYQDFRRRSMGSELTVSFDTPCCCDWCCFIGHNSRIHKVMKWVAPFVYKKSPQRARH